MKVMLDEVELPLSSDILEEGKEAIYETAKRAALAKNRVIVEILVDGEPVYDEDAFFALSGGIDIRFSTQPIRDLVRESMSEGAKYFPALKRGLEDIATLFEERRDHDAQVKFAQAIEGINWLVSVFDRSCILLGLTADVFKTGDFRTDFDELNRVLDDMASAMESGKTMSLAYLIRERLLPVVTRFSAYWDEVNAQLETPIQ